MKKETDVERKNNNKEKERERKRERAREREGKRGEEREGQKNIQGAEKSAEFFFHSTLNINDRDIFFDQYFTTNSLLAYFFKGNALPAKK